jgi:predicted Zn-dependent protease with MMP-like domain
VRELLRAPIKAAAAALFIVGTVLFLLNPPSLSGAQGLVGLVAGAIALVVLTTAVTVVLTGRDAMSEREFERLVERSEELARSAQLETQPTEFDLIVAEALDNLPVEFQELLERTPVIVSHRGAEHRAYGRYYGDTVARDNYADRIVIYQDTLERDFGHDPDVLRAQVERTVRHELAHHLGWRERGVRELGL